MYSTWPSWPALQLDRRLSGKEFAQGLLDVLAPDFVIEDEEGLSRELDFDAERVLQRESILPTFKDDLPVCGHSVIDIYRQRYRTEFQFRPSSPRKVVEPIAKEESHSSFVAMCLGRIPQDPNLRHIGDEYRAAFEPDSAPVAASSCLELILNGVEFPLRIGKFELEMSMPRAGRDLTLYLMRATDQRDQINFWNLRALGYNILPVPDLSIPSIKQSLLKVLREEREHGQHLGRKSVITLLAGNSVKQERLDYWHSELREEHPDGLVKQTWLPRLWNERARRRQEVGRGTLSTGNDDELMCQVRDGYARIPLEGPSFSRIEPFSRYPKWVNALELGGAAGFQNIPNAFPPGGKNLGRLLSDLGSETKLYSPRGLLAGGKSYRSAITWRIPSRWEVFEAWLKDIGLDSRQSSAGKICERVVEQLNGPGGAVGLADARVLRLLRALGGKAANSDDSSPRIEVDVNGSVDLNGIHKLLSSSNDEGYWTSDRIIEWLIQSRILSIGLSSSCCNCGQPTWTAIDDIGSELDCTRCLSKFAFPASSPPGTESWRYRARGPVAIEDNARGGICAALALRLLTVLCDHRHTWVSGLEILDGGQSVAEFDLALWVRRSDSRLDAPRLVLVECKSMRNFEQTDFARARQAIQRFPESVLVFATLKEDLGRLEKKRLKKLALEGREILPGVGWKNPVLILTRAELASRMGPPWCWQDMKAEEYNELYQHSTGRNLLALCSASQKRHLDLPLFHDYRYA